jgi:cell division septum initiation protein DivIVA
MAEHEDVELVPPGFRFDPVVMAYDLAGLLEESRSQVDRLHERLDRLCHTPLAPAAVEERLRRLIELAHAEAAAIVARARATAEHIHTMSLERTRQREAYAELGRQQIEDDFLIAMAARRLCGTIPPLRRAVFAD